MLTYIPMENCGYIVVSHHVGVCSQLWAHILYMGHGFISLFTHAAFGVMIYSKYLCLVIRKVLNSRSRTAVIKASLSIYKLHSFQPFEGFFIVSGLISFCRLLAM